MSVATFHPISQLTKAERVVSQLVAEGRSNGEIAHRLGLSRHTIESHLKHIFVKLAITSRVQLAVLVCTAPAA
jgi:DNA-binding CsgD family transcriptional regulator